MPGRPFCSRPELESTVLEAAANQQRIVLLGDGNVICSLEPEKFLRSREPEVEAYVHAFHRGRQTAAGGERP